jgi:cell division initiation protein
MVNELKTKDMVYINLQKKYDAAIEQLERYKSMEAVMNKTIVAAQDSGEQIRRIAKQESDMILSEARSNANRIVGDALVRAEKAEFETAQLRKNVSVAKKKLRNDVQSIVDMVDDIEVLDL